MKKNSYSIIKKSILIMLPIAVLSIIFIPIRSAIFTRILLLPIERKYDIKIEFSKSTIMLSSNISMNNVSILDKNKQLYYIGDTEIKYNATELLSAKKRASFNLKRLKVYNNVRILDSVAEILVISTLPQFEFDEIDCRAEFRRSSIYIDHLIARNNSMHVEGGGLIGKDGLLDCKLKFSFAKSVTDEIPDAIKKTLLTKEDGGWRSIKFDLTGNYKKPTLSISSSLLKLNIMEGIIGK
ncbi:MAG: hypothetical protein JW800_06900 [Candidatus Omnitrophica bacterium]|nr:hypothetical protein [Candidatus Omnitrophota bacterium]